MRQPPSVRVAVIVAALVTALAGMAGTSGVPDLWQTFWITIAALVSGGTALITDASLKKRLCCDYPRHMNTSNNLFMVLWYI